MRVREIVLENFKSHERTRIRFGDGVILLLGANGAGKTGVLEGIAYAIYPDLFSGRMASLIRRGAGRMRVALTFEVGGRTYRVVRERDARGNAAARLMVDEGGGEFKPVQFGQRDVSAEMERILGVGPTAFVDAVYVRQGEILGFLSGTPSRRKEVVARLLGSEFFSRLEEEVREAESRYREKKAEAAARAEKVPGLRRKLAEIRKEMESVRESARELGREVADLEAKLRDVQKRLREIGERRTAYEAVSAVLSGVRSEIEARESELRKIKRRMDELSAELERKEELERIAGMTEPLRALREIREKESFIDGRLQELEERKKELERCRNRLSELEGVLEDVKSLRKRIDSLREEIAALKVEAREEATIRSKMDEISERIAELTRVWKEVSALAAVAGIPAKSPGEVSASASDALRKLRKRTSELEREGVSIERSLGELRSELDRVEDWISSLESSEGRCPLCGSPLEASERERLLERYRKERAETLDRLREFAERKESIESEKRELLRRRETLEEVVRTCAESGLGEMEKLEAELNDLREKLRRARSAGERARELEAEMNRVLERLASAEGAADEVNFLRRKIEEMESGGNRAAAEERSLRDEKEKLEAERARIIETMGGIPADIDRAYEEAEMAKNLLKDLKEIVEEHRNLVARSKSIEADLERLRERAERLRAEAKSIGYDRTVEERLEREVEGLSAELGEKRSALARLEGRLEELRREEEQRSGELREAEEAAKSLERLDRFLSLLERVRWAFGKEGIQRSLREKTRPLVEEHAWEYLSRFGINCDGLSLSEDWEVGLLRGGEIYGMSELSGGEAVAVALSLRLGLARALSGGQAEMIMLDEPTVHLDEDRRAELVGLLREVGLPQVIVVSHTGEFEQAADEVVRLPVGRGEKGLLAGASGIGEGVGYGRGRWGPL